MGNGKDGLKSFFSFFYSSIIIKQVRLEGGFKEEAESEWRSRVFEANCSKQMGQRKKKKIFHQMFLCVFSNYNIMSSSPISYSLLMST